MLQRITRTVPQRIERLRAELFATPDSVCFERARIVTRSDRSTVGQHPALRRAKAISDVLGHMPIFIRPGELLVGQRAGRLGARAVYPEFHLSGLSRDDIPDEVRQYWEGRTLGDIVRATHSPELRRAERELACAYVTGTASGFGHVIADYEKVLAVGFEGIIDEAQWGLERIGERDPDGRAFLEAVAIAATGIINWARRYADLADSLAGQNDDPGRAQELREIAAICRRVPGKPARNFREALQSFWFTHLALHIEQYGWSISAGRFDQYMLPFFRGDMDRNVLDEDRAWELLLSLWIKFMENVGTRIRQTTFQNLTLGGQDADGIDQSNDLSFMCLDATVALRFNQPALSVRWHPGIDQSFAEHIVRTIGQGTGMPALFNDEVVIDALMRNGVSREDAVGYGIVGCVEACVPGKQQGVTAGGHLNVAKALELALNEGRSLVSGERIGTGTPDPTTFRRFDDLWKAYTQQVEHLARLNVEAAEAAGRAQKRYGHCPLLSSVLDDCLTLKRDLVDGGTRYNLSGLSVFGATNACDAMAAIQQMVCEEGRLTWGRLRRALQSNFDGQEPLRLTLANRKQRFGNDVAESDELANRINAVHVDVFARHVDTRGGRYLCGVWPVEGHVQSGRWTGASADGRKSGDPLVDGVGACQGADRNGPTALLRSVAQLDHAGHWPAGNTCNIKFSRACFRDYTNLRKVWALVSTYMELGGQQLQVNVVDAAVLRDAQERPDVYQDLIVRVAGFSAYFTQLSAAVQNEIIARTEYGV